MSDRTGAVTIELYRTCYTPHHTHNLWQSLTEYAPGLAAKRVVFRVCSLSGVVESGDVGPRVMVKEQLTEYLRYKYDCGELYK